MNKIWMIRAGSSAVYFDDFIESASVWVGMSPLLGADVLKDDRKTIVAKAAAAHPEWTKGKVSSQAGQLFRFLSELKVGDTITTYDPSQRIYMIGSVTSAAECPKNDCYKRAVKWTQHVGRDQLSVPTRNSLGSISTIFQLSASASAELLKCATGLTEPLSLVAPTAQSSSKATDATVSDIVVENLEKSRQFVEDSIASLGPYQLQDLVAGILRAMGYKTSVAPKGPDRGIDIFASPDGLGLEEPRIFVEVKHRKNTAMGTQEVRSFMGGRQPGDRCLFVSTGGFTKEAKYEAERSNVPLQLLNLPKLRELLIDHYDNVDAETKRLVPLVCTYWPAPTE